MEITNYLIATGVNPESGLTFIEPIRPLSKDEYATYKEAVEYLAEFRESEEILPMVAGNLEGYLRLSQAVIHDANPNRWTADDKLRLARELNRELINFLGSARLYLDHMQTRLTRRYGVAGKPSVALKVATAEAYDHEPAYRILYKMRNFLQHCGMPIRMVGVYSRMASTPDKPSVTEVLIDCDVTDLLDRYDSWGRAKADLTTLAPKLDLMQLGNKMFGELEQIDRVVRASEFPYLHQFGSAILALLQEVINEDTSGLVGEVDVAEGGVYTMKLIEPPMDMLARLGLVHLLP